MPIFNEAIECVKCNNGPWASTESDSCVDVAGYWHFPSPDVTNEGVACNPIIFESARPETKPPIRIVSLKQGYLVVPNVFEGYADDDLAFTDAVDLAEWLLEWLGLESEREGLAVLDFKWDLDEAKRALDVVRAAQAYVEAEGGVTVWARLAEAVKKWRGIDNEESRG